MDELVRLQTLLRFVYRLSFLGIGRDVRGFRRPGSWTVLVGIGVGFGVVHESKSLVLSIFPVNAVSRFVSSLVRNLWVEDWRPVRA